MRLSIRLTLVIGLLGLVAVASVSSLSWYLADQEIRSAVDEQLLEQAARLEEASDQDIDRALLEELSGVDQLADTAAVPTAFLIDNDEGGIRFYDDTGQPLGSEHSLLTNGVRQRLADGDNAFLETVTTDRGTYRVLTGTIDQSRLPRSDLPLATVQIYSEIGTEEAALTNLAFQLLATASAGVLLVAAGSWIIGRWLAHPLQRVTAGAERLALLEDPPGRIELDRGAGARTDEIKSLTDSFNRMLSALEVAKEQQQRLVADASHELRTPLTSIRMSTEFLAANEDLPMAARRDVLQRAVADVEQLSALVSDLVDLAADVRSDDEPFQDVVLDELIQDVAASAAAASGRTINVEVDGTHRHARPSMVRRAVSNLVDNAVKYSPDGTPITVRSRAGRIEVLDHGPGIAPEDAAHVFDRFFRSPKARSRPGNGIGLAIVQQVAQAHGGSTWVANRPAGGAVVGFSVP